METIGGSRETIVAKFLEVSNMLPKEAQKRQGCHELRCVGGSVSVDNDSDPSADVL